MRRKRQMTGRSAPIEQLEGRRLLAVTSVVNVSHDSTYEGEPTIAVNPTNSNTQFMASNDATGIGLFASWSSDGGATWHNRVMASGSDGLPVACCDPEATFDQFGNLFLVYLNSTATDVDVVRSIDGGQTFTLYSEFAASDQPNIATGSGGSVATGSVWISYEAWGGILAAGAPVYGFNNFGSFGAPHVVSQDGPVGPYLPMNFGDIAVGPSGNVSVVMQENRGTQGPTGIAYNHDPDGLGPTAFGYANISTLGTNVGDFDFIPAQPNRSIDAEANLAWDSTGGIFNNRLYMVYTDESVNENNDTNIFVRWSTDGGATWGSPIRVNDDVGLNSQFLPEIAVDPTSGFVAVSWYDARNDNGVIGSGSTNGTANDDAEFYAAVSMNGGATWQPNVVVNANLSNATSDHNPNDYGDFTGLAFYGRTFFPVFDDNSATLATGSPEFDVATRRMPLSFSGAVFNDTNGNGIWDGGETAHSGVTVYLDDNNNGVLDTAEARKVTDSKGRYAFVAASNGTKHLRVVPPTGTHVTFPSGGVWVVTQSSWGTSINDFGLGTGSLAPLTQPQATPFATTHKIRNDLIASSFDELA